MLNTTSSHLDELAVEQLTRCASGMVSADITNRAAWTPGVDDDRPGNPRPDITDRLEQFLVYSRALGPTANVDKQYEEMRVHVARLPRPDWVPCKGGARHDELARVTEAYSLITRETRLRASLVEFEVALARFKRERDEAERCARLVQRGEVEDAGEILRRAIATLAEARRDAVQCSMECTSMMQECECCPMCALPC